MKDLSFKQIENISAGDSVDNFCAGFGAVAAVYGVGVLVNWWNPIGWTASVAGATLGTGCAIYSLR